jgi:hypothetical protein
MLVCDTNTIKTLGDTMKTLTLVALLSIATFSAMAEETPLMTQTQNQAESTRIQQQEERQTMQSNMYGKKSDVENGTGIKTQTQTQTRTRTQLQDGSGGGQNMNGGMQGGGMKRGGR